MSANINHVTLIGRLGADPERVETRTGNAMARMSVATNSGFGENAKVEWHNVICFEKVADKALEHYGKGDLVYLEGRLEYTRVDGHNGPKYFTDIRAWRISRLARPQPLAPDATLDDTATPPSAAPEEAMREGFTEEAIPF